MATLLGRPLVRLLVVSGCALLATAGVPRPAAAQDPTTSDRSRAAEADDRPQPARLRIHGVILAAGAGALIASGALQSRLAPAACRWCDVHADGTDALNGLDRRVRDWWRWNHAGTADTTSSVLALGVIPAAAIGLDYWAARADGHGPDAKIDALVIAEAAVLAANATQALKYLTARQRPYAHARALGQPTDVPSGSGDNLSFSSDHTATAFALAVSAARVATLRRYGRARWLWRIGLPAAAAVGYLRIAADQHHLTDVLAGAGVGTALGVVVPHLVFSDRAPPARSRTRLSVQPLWFGPFAGVRCTW